MLTSKITLKTQAVGTSSCPHFTTKYLPPACMYKPRHTCPLYVYSSEVTFTIRIMKYQHFHPPGTSFCSKYNEILTFWPSRGDYGSPPKGPRTPYWSRTIRILSGNYPDWDNMDSQLAKPISPPAPPTTPNQRQIAKTKGNMCFLTLLSSPNCSNQNNYMLFGTSEHSRLLKPQ